MAKNTKQKQKHTQKDRKSEQQEEKYPAVRNVVLQKLSCGWRLSGPAPGQQSAAPWFSFVAAWCKETAVLHEAIQ